MIIRKDQIKGKKAIKDQNNRMTGGVHGFAKQSILQTPLYPRGTLQCKTADVVDMSHYSKHFANLFAKIQVLIKIFKNFPAVSLFSLTSNKVEKFKMWNSFITFVVQLKLPDINLISFL